MKKPQSLLSVALLVATALAGAFLAAPPSASVAAAPAGLDVPVTSIDPKLTRRVLTLMESVRGGPVAPGRDNAYLESMATPLYRPDLGDAVAYYEYRVSVREAATGAVLPAGFIIVSTGGHDFPIAHWNFQGESPTQELLRKATIPGVPPPMGRFYRLDALAYAMEDLQGNLLATSNTTLHRIVGLPPFDPLKPPQTSAATWVFPAPPPATDPASDQGTTVTATLRTSGPVSSTIQFLPWDSWGQLKTEYLNWYGPMIDGLRYQASGDWQTEALLDQYGEGLRKGDVRIIPLLSPNANTDLSGTGAQYVRMSNIMLPGGMPALRLDVLASFFDQELPFIVHVNLPAETIPFTIISPPHRFVLPAIMKAADGGAAPSLSQASDDSGDVHKADAWSEWYYFWAGSHGDQRAYSQIPPASAPNTSGCYSGCGGTAWAMLFGWADNQAALGNPRWAPRNGIYRISGGYGGDAVAPATMDAGVRNMTWEIRNRIGTFCFGSSGATPPWNMSGAQGYLNGRSYTHVDTHYNVLGIHEDRLMDYARDSIRYRGAPAIIGTGWLTHYPLAYGYAFRSLTVRHCFFVCWTATTDYNRAFYVNEGWGGAGNGWVASGTWFAGEAYP